MNLWHDTQASRTDLTSLSLIVHTEHITHVCVHVATCRVPSQNCNLTSLSKNLPSSVHVCVTYRLHVVVRLACSSPVWHTVEMYLEQKQARLRCVVGNAHVSLHAAPGGRGRFGDAREIVHKLNESRFVWFCSN